jgi:plasmid stabilization system protein ParE
MNRVDFDETALRDLTEIVECYREVAPHSLDRILSDIFRSIRQLSDFPLSGPAVPGEVFRRIVTIKYGFKIAYEVASGEVLIIGIFRYQDRQR